MDRLLHTAQAMLSLVALVSVEGHVAKAGAAVTGLLSWRAIRAMPPAAPALAEALARDMQAELDKRGVPADQHALIADMIAATLPEPSTLIDASLDPERVLAQMEARLQGTEQRNLDSLHLFQIVLRPRLQKLLTDPEFTKTLDPEFKRAVLDELRGTRADVQEVAEKIDLLPGQFAALLDKLPNATRPELVAVADRFDIPQPEEMTDTALRRELEKRAEDWRALRREIAAIPETMKQLSNLKGAAQAAFDAGRFEEVEMLLARVHQVELEEAAKTAELRAETALLRGRVDQAFTLLSSAADSLRPIDPLEPARRRILYSGKLSAHGARYGGTGVELGLELLTSILTDELRGDNSRIWASGQLELGRGYRLLGSRIGGNDGAELLLNATVALRASLDVFTRREFPVTWASIQNDLGIALIEQGVQIFGSDRADILKQAVSAYIDALTVRTPQDFPFEWAETQSNLGNAYIILSDRVSKPLAQEALREAEDIFQSVLRVDTLEDRPVEWAATQINLGNALRLLGKLTSGHAGLDKLKQAEQAYCAAKKVFIRSEYPLEWARVEAILGSALMEIGLRTTGTEGEILMERAGKALKSALEVRTRDEHPVNWAETHLKLCLLYQALADHDTCADPSPHLRAALAHVEAALEVFDPEHMHYYHQHATTRRDQLRKALGGGA